MNSNFKGVIFDMDGTLTLPTFDFVKIRNEICVPEGDIVETLNSWPEEKSSVAWEIIHRYELEALENIKLHDGAYDTVMMLKDLGKKVAVLTRNSQKSADAFLEHSGLEFDIVLTRDFPYIKPDPRPLLHIIEQWGVDADDVLMVGDYIHDIECGNAAGTKTCYFHNPDTTAYGEFADYIVANYEELNEILFKKV